MGAKLTESEWDHIACDCDPGDVPVTDGRCPLHSEEQQEPEFEPDALRALIDQVLAARPAPTVLDREAVAREIDRAFYQEGDSDGLSFRALAAADAVLALPGVTQAHHVDREAVRASLVRDQWDCEEVAEAYAESDHDKLRAELIQVAAVAVAWVEKLDRDKRAGMSRWTIKLTHWLCRRCGAVPATPTDPTDPPPGWTRDTAGTDRCDTCSVTDIEEGPR